MTIRRGVRTRTLVSKEERTKSWKVKMRKFEGNVDDEKVKDGAIIPHWEKITGFYSLLSETMQRQKKILVK